MTGAAFSALLDREDVEAELGESELPLVPCKLLDAPGVIRLGEDCLADALVVLGGKFCRPGLTSSLSGLDARRLSSVC